jgi:hypothetical protein
VYGWLYVRFGFVILFIGLLYNSWLHFINHCHKTSVLNLTLSTSRFLVTALSNGDSSASVLTTLNCTDLLFLNLSLAYKISAKTTQKTPFLLLYHCCVRVCWGSHVIATQPVHWCAVGYLARTVVSLFVSRSLPINWSIRHNMHNLGSLLYLNSWTWHVLQDLKISWRIYLLQSSRAVSRVNVELKTDVSGPMQDRRDGGYLWNVGFQPNIDAADRQRRF